MTVEFMEQDGGVFWRDSHTGTMQGFVRVSLDLVDQQDLIRRRIPIRVLDGLVKYFLPKELRLGMEHFLTMNSIDPYTPPVEPEYVNEYD